MRTLCFITHSFFHPTFPPQRPTRTWTAPRSLRITYRYPANRVFQLQATSVWMRESERVCVGVRSVAWLPQKEPVLFRFQRGCQLKRGMLKTFICRTKPSVMSRSAQLPVNPPFLLVLLTVLQFIKLQLNENKWGGKKKISFDKSADSWHLYLGFLLKHL